MGTRDVGAKRRRSDATKPAAGAGLRILAVDDDAAYLRYLRLVLTRAGFDVELANNGSAAIERLRVTCDIDLLLIDLAMPGIDGIETVRRIQAECRVPALYTILLTARGGTETKLRALNSGLDDFLSKTSSESEIVARLRSAARRLEMERRLLVMNEELQTLALTDELTGVANRRALFRAGEDILKASRHLSVVLVDLDHFKEINDTFGHLTGDRILADVGAMFNANTRFGDIIGRYGGDEFVLLLPDTQAEEARQISDRILAKIRQLTWTISGNVLSVTGQFGIASSSPGSTLNELLAICDQGLYKRKRLKRPISSPAPHG